jgi:hypothetical protein
MAWTEGLQARSSVLDLAPALPESGLATEAPHAHTAIAAASAQSAGGWMRAAGGPRNRSRIQYRQ